MIKEVRNFLPKNYLRDIQYYVDDELTWSYLSDTAYQDDVGLGLADKQMSAQIYPNKFANPEQNKFSFLYPILYLVEEKFEVQMQVIKRFKFNMTFAYSDSEPPESWHVDDLDPTVKSVVIYINESDGGTVVADSRATAHIVTPEKRVELASSPKVKAEYERNKAIMFDSSFHHYGELPRTHKNRVVINIVFKAE